MDNEFVSHRRTRARSLEMQDQQNNLPSIKEEQENQPSRHFKEITMFYDRSEQASHVERKKLSITQLPQENIKEKIMDEDFGEEEEEEELSSQSNQHSANSLRSCQHPHRPKKVRSCQSLNQLKVDEMDLGSHRSRHRRDRTASKQDVIEEENEHEKNSQSCISQSLSNERVYLKKIIKGEMLSSHAKDIGLMTGPIPQQPVEGILEIQSSEDSQREALSS